MTFEEFIEINKRRMTFNGKGTQKDSWVVLL